MVLDGELVVLRDGRPDLGSIQARHQAAERWKIRHLAQTRPVTYVVFDLLYVDYRSVTGEPLTQRND